MLGQSEKISDEGKVEEHVALKNESARGKVSKRGIGSAAARMHGSGDGFVDSGVGVCGGLRMREMNECANDLSNSTMDGFNDGVGSGRVGGNPDGSDARIIKGELEIVAGKFRTILVDDTEGAGVTGKPLIFEQCPGSVGRLGTLKAANLDQIGDWVNAGEGLEAEFNVVDGNSPRTNAINMNFTPWGDWIFTGSEMTMRFCRETYLRADGA